MKLSPHRIEELKRERLEVARKESISEVNKYYDEAIKTGSRKVIYLDKCAYTKYYLMGAYGISFNPILSSNKKVIGVKVCVDYAGKEESRVLCKNTFENPKEVSLAAAYEFYANYILNHYYNKRDLERGCLGFVEFNINDLQIYKKDVYKNIDEQIKIFGTDTYPEDRKRKFNRNGFIGNIMSKAVPGTVYYMEIENCPYIEVLYPNLERINLEVVPEGHKVTAVFPDRNEIWTVKQTEEMFKKYMKDKDKSYTEIIDKYPIATKHGRAKKLIDDAFHKALYDSLMVSIKAPSGKEIEIYPVVYRLPGAVNSGDRPTKVILDKNNQVKETHVPSLIIRELKGDNIEPEYIFAENWDNKNPKNIVYFKARVEDIYRYAFENGIGEPGTKISTSKYYEFRDRIKLIEEVEREEREAARRARQEAEREYE